MSTVNEVANLYKIISEGVISSDGEVSSSEHNIEEASFEIGPGHKGAMRGKKIYDKGKGTSNPHERDTFLKRTGPQLPLVKKKATVQTAGFEPEGENIQELGGLLSTVDKVARTTTGKVGGAIGAHKGRGKFGNVLGIPEKIGRQRGRDKATGMYDKAKETIGGVLNKNSYEPEGDMTEGIFDLFSGKKQQQVRQGTYHQQKPGQPKKTGIFSNVSRRNEMLRKARGLSNSYELEGDNIQEKEEVRIGGGNLKKLTKKAVKRIDTDVSGFVDKNDKSMGSYGEFIPSPNGKKRVFTKINNEEYILERGMSSKDIYNILKNHKYTKQELWDMQRKATERGDHGVAHGIYSRWKEMKNEEYISEREMTASEKRKESRLKKKFDDSAMKKSMIDQYGKERGTQIYFATIRKQAMQDSFDYDDAYDYIIEMLVAAEFAKDYEAAELMFEHISDEFTSAILEEYIEEKARGTRKKTTVHAYDVDETLFGHGKKGKPNVQVHVKDDSGKRVQSLSNQEFNTHKLKPGHKYDFGEFQSAKKFRETSSPNKKVIKDIKRKQARGQNVHLVTARSKFDDPSEFQGHLKKHGVNVDKANIHYTGGMKGGDVGKKKVKVVDAVAKKAGAKKAHMYDDAAKVHKGFEAAKKDKPTSMKYKTHMVAPDKKTGESRVRSYQATKNEETAYDYWKQFIN